MNTNLSKFELKTYSIPFGKARLKVPISIVKGASNNNILAHKELRDVLNEIVDESNKELISLTKQLHEAKANNLPEYRKVKEKECKGLIIGKYSVRKDAACELYVPLIGFDIDALESPFITDCLLADCRNCPYIFLAFPSPSGLGLRIFVWCDSTADNHKNYYTAVCKMLSEYLKIKTDKIIRFELKDKGKNSKEISKLLKSKEHIDTSTSNISRIWFYTHLKKEDIYLNEKSKIYKLPITTQIVKTKRPPSPTVATTFTPLDEKEKVRLCVMMAEKRNIPTGRNNSLYPLACLMREHGLSEQAILGYCLSLQETDFTESEIIKTVKSAIQRATFQKFTDLQLINWRAKVEDHNNKSDTKTPPNDAIQSETSNKESTFSQIKRFISNKYELRLNTIANEIEYRLKGTTDEYKELNENDLICELLELGYNGVESKLIALLRSSFVPAYDPIESYFKNLPNWDKQTDYIGLLASYVKTNDQDWFDAQFKKMLVRLVACALGQIPFNKQCFTLKGGQDDGKTTFIRFLCPPILKNYYKEDVDITTKDGRLALCQNMAINFEELDGLSKYELNKIKAMFTVDTVKERLPYDRKPKIFKRRVSFFATTNKEEILTDETGNVRWLIFEVLEILHDNGGEHGYNQNINIDYVYSQAYSLLQSGFNFKLTPDEIDYSERKNKDYLVRTPEQELLQEYCEPSTKGEEGQFFTGTILMEKLKEISKTRLSLKKLGNALKILGYGRISKYDKNKKQSIRGYWIKLNDNYQRKLEEIESRYKRNN